MENSKLKGIVFIFTSTLVYGFQSVLTRLVLVSGISPLVLTGLKLLGGLFTITVMMLVMKKKVTFPREDLKTWIAFGLIGGTFFSFFLAASYSMNGASQGVILLYTAPAFTIILAKLFLKEEITKLKILALILVIIGTFCVSLGSLEGEIKFTVLGLSLGLASGLCYGIFNILGKKLSHRYDSLSINFFMVLIASISMLPVFPFYNWGSLLGDKLNLTLIVLLYGFLIFGVGNFFFMKGMQYLEAGTVSVLANTEPIIAIILSVLILKETLLPLQIFGVFAVLAGAFLVSIGNRGYQQISG